MTWYKIVELDKNNNIKTLFHGINKSRILKVGEWLKAELKMVKDGTSKTEYLSGWHIAPTYEECKNYLGFFKHQHNKIIVSCKAKNVWPKSHSRSNIFLAEHIIIKEIVYA